MTIAEQIPLHDKNWFCTGGPARYFAEPTTTQEFVAVVQYAVQRGLDIFVLGQGANILVSDQGFDGLVIRPQLQAIEYDAVAQTVTAGAGVDVQQLIVQGIQQGFLGLEEFSGIPGTVGGSVYINIHYFKFLLSDYLVCATVVEKATGTLYTVDAAWFCFGYNQSTLQRKDYYLVDATFKLRKADAVESAYARGRRDEIVRHRRQRYPHSNTCGSFFRNFLEQEIPFEINGKKIPYVAYYLDKIGVKGELRVGNAAVSYQHANMLVTLPGATSADMVGLARRMQELVYERFGIIPQPECQLVGFTQWPFLTQPEKRFNDVEPYSLKQIL